MKKHDELLEVLEKSVSIILRDKFKEVVVHSEYDPTIRATCVDVIGKALGQVLGGITFPAHWERLLKTKNCPQYMRDLVSYRVEAYYPKLSLPDEPNWITFTKDMVRTYATS